MTSQPTQMKGRTGLREWLTPRKLRQWREYLTAYLMVAPATILIFIFGIFPVAFALYMSLQKWRLKRGDFLGLDNYTNAIGVLGYVLFFALGVGLLVWAFFRFRSLYREFEGDRLHYWLLHVPGLLVAAAGFSLVRWVVTFFPNILDIANKITGVEKTRELFVQLIGEALHTPEVLAARNLGLWLLAAAVLAMAAATWRWRSTKSVQKQLELALSWMLVAIGSASLYFVYAEMLRAYTEAVQTGADPGILPQFFSIVGGLLLIFVGWKIWDGASNQHSTVLFFLRLGGATVFLVGGWIMIGELPVIVASGDEDLWMGLKNTLFYSLGTIPFQLSISMFLAVLLFQKLKGSQFFRMVYFLPYVTPTVASAAVFRQLFSNRLQAPVNAFMRLLGLEPLGWLWEPKGVLTLMANGLGIENWPTWAAGPSLALVVIIIYSIWVFVGYDTVIYLAGLSNIPNELSEAAEVDGANRWQIFKNITFPLLSPTTYFLTLIAIIGTFKAFNHIWIMRLDSALGTADTFSVFIFLEFFEKLRYGYSSAMAIILFVIILGLTYVNNRTQGQRVFYG